MHAKDERSDAEFPPLDDYEQWLIENTQSVGLNTLNWAELNNWKQLTGISLSAWECETMIRLSSIYISGIHEYSQDGAPSPYITDQTKQKAREKVASVFAAMRAKHG